MKARNTVAILGRQVVHGISVSALFPPALRDNLFSSGIALFTVHFLRTSAGRCMR